MKCLILCTFMIVCLSNVSISETTSAQPEENNESVSNPLAGSVFNGNEKLPENAQTDAPHSRVKRQYYYDPYYYQRRPYYAIPIPIVIGGFGGFGFGRSPGFGFGRPGFGGRGFGFGRPGFSGFGGRGFGGFGGRGFGGFGGRGFGGFGGGRGGRG